MKNKIYRTVSVEERLPKHGGHFLTDIGLVRFMINDKEWVDDKYITCNPNWWLEEITNPDQAQEVVNELFGKYELLPSEDEIQEAFSKSDIGNIEGSEFHEGANFILNHIKGG